MALVTTLTPVDPNTLQGDEVADYARNLCRVLDELDARGVPSPQREDVAFDTLARYYRASGRIQ